MQQLAFSTMTATPCTDSQAMSPTQWLESHTHTSHCLHKILRLPVRFGRCVHDGGEAAKLRHLG